MIEIMDGQVTMFDLDIWSGKTSPERSVPTAEKISGQSSKKPQKSQTKLPLFLDLRGGRWTPSGCILGNGWSVAWRVHDAQFWGVPQRRKRIALVADFGGFTAPEILFEREGLSGNTEPLGKEGKAVAGDIEASAETASVTMNNVAVYALDRASFNQGQNAQYDFSIEEEAAQTLVSRGPGGY